MKGSRAKGMRRWRDALFEWERTRGALSRWAVWAEACTEMMLDPFESEQ